MTHGKVPNTSNALFLKSPKEAYFARKRQDNERLKNQNCETSFKRKAPKRQQSPNL